MLLRPLHSVSPLAVGGVGPEVVGSEVVGPEVVGSEVVGSEVVRSEVVGAEVVGAEVVGDEVVGGSDGAVGALLGSGVGQPALGMFTHCPRAGGWGSGVGSGHKEGSTVSDAVGQKIFEFLYFQGGCGRWREWRVRA